MPGPRIVVVGLGYVGLPLAEALARHFDVAGFDVDSTRIGELRRGFDRTREVESDALAGSPLQLTDSPDDCRGADVYILTVPTPVDSEHRPDFVPLLAAARMVGGVLDPARRPTVIVESTVHPGATEEICGPEIERSGGLSRGRDFRLGYSPERINPGDREHRLEAIPKVIAGEDEEVVEQMAAIYGPVTGGLFRAASIKAAEAAKAIENAQRDINIAFLNEVAQICSRVDVSVWDVLAAARTKWNFLPFEPGLVGGHCIGVDPYYLSALAERLGHDPQVILSGRHTNDSMGRWIADAIHQRRGGAAGSALVMGLTFKENVPDLRNSRSFDLAGRLSELGYSVEVADPLADAAEIERDYAMKPIEPDGRSYDLVVGAVAHRAYRDLDDLALEGLVRQGGMLADIKGMWRERKLRSDVERWTL